MKLSLGGKHDLALEVLIQHFPLVTVQQFIRDREAVRILNDETARSEAAVAPTLLCPVARVA